MGLSEELICYAENIWRRFPEVFISLGAPNVEEMFSLCDCESNSYHRITDTKSKKVIEIMLPRRQIPDSDLLGVEFAECDHPEAYSFEGGLLSPSPSDMVYSDASNVRSPIPSDDMWPAPGVNVSSSQHTSPSHGLSPPGYSSTHSPDFSTSSSRSSQLAMRRGKFVPSVITRRAGENAAAVIRAPELDRVGSPSRRGLRFDFDDSANEPKLVAERSPLVASLHGIPAKRAAAVPRPRPLPLDDSPRAFATGPQPPLRQAIDEDRRANFATKYKINPIGVLSHTNGTIIEGPGSGTGADHTDQQFNWERHVSSPQSPTSLSHSSCCTEGEMRLNVVDFSPGSRIERIAGAKRHPHVGFQRGAASSFSQQWGTTARHIAGTACDSCYGVEFPCRDAARDGSFGVRLQSSAASRRHEQPGQLDVGFSSMAMTPESYSGICVGQDYFDSRCQVGCEEFAYPHRDLEPGSPVKRRTEGPPHELGRNGW